MCTSGRTPGPRAAERLRPARTAGVRRRPLALALLVIALAGCGNERRPAPPLDADPSTDAQTLRYPRVGLTVDVSASFSIADAERPGVFRAAFGAATVAAFAYRRREELPRTDRALEEAANRLRKAARERSPSLSLDRVRTLRVAGARAIELLGSQTLSQTRLRTRSLHVFKGRGEYVIELLAPPREFRRLDPRVFAGVRETLEITGEVPRTER